MFKPLPMANYKSSRVAFDQQVPPTSESENKALPKFGLEETVQARVKQIKIPELSGSRHYINDLVFQVVRHVGRERVPKDADFLKQNNSPMGTLTIRKPDNRESMFPDLTMDETNTMEMSIRQVVEVKKMTSAWNKH